MLLTTRRARTDSLAELRDLLQQAARREHDRLFAGGDVDAWLDAMQALVKQGHAGAYAIGRDGDWAKMTRAEWGRIGQVIRGQYAFLRPFADEVRAGHLSPAQVRARFDLYLEAASQSRELGEAYRRGLPPSVFPALPGDGSTSCRARCRCRWSIRVLSRGRGDYDLSWRLGPAEHCAECRTRAKAWRKLQVRGGVLRSGYDIIGTFR